MDKVPYTPGMREVLKLSKSEAAHLGYEEIIPEHYLLATIKKGDGLAVEILQNLNIDLNKIRIKIEKAIANNVVPSVGIFHPNESAQLILSRARKIAQTMKHGWVGTEHLLLSLIKEGDNYAYKALTEVGLNYSKVEKEVLKVIEGSASKSGKDGKKSKTPALDTFGRDLTLLAKEEKLDPVIGREDEVERILQILCRRTKNNPILLGEPGVGKTAIVEGLAQKIVSGDIPDILKNRRLISLDLAQVVAGTKYRGQFEERLKAIMKEIRQNDEIILFIDEIHTLIGAGAAEGAIDASNMLKPALSRGELQCIGATTLDEYRKYIEKDGALERRFQSVIVDPPSVKNTIEILKGLRSKYEDHHNIIIGDDVIVESVNLADRYITDRYMPDKAIDVIDEAGSRVRLRSDSKPEELVKVEKEIEQLNDKIRTASHNQEFEKCQTIKSERDNLIQNKNEISDKWKSSIDTGRRAVSIDDVAHVVSKWSGIPAARLEESEIKRLKNIESEISKRVVGQQDAIESISRAIRRSRSGLKDPSRPSGNFMFLGPTGVGKTELAKALAEFLFGDENALVRIDMSEYMEKHSVSRLIGAPPGYVGYNEGGQLTEKVRRKPYCVILLDEIEKAHKEIYNLLLQIFDEGILTDSAGRKVDFRNTIIIMTSNIGTKFLRNTGGMGFHSGDYMLDHSKVKEKIMSEVKKTFNPEFVNRLDDLIAFKSLDKDEIKKIIDILISKLNKRVEERGIIIEIDEKAKSFLINKGYDSEYGARPMKRAIQKYIEDLISLLLIDGSIVDKSIIRVTHNESNEDNLEFDIETPSSQEDEEIKKQEPVEV